LESFPGAFDICQKDTNKAIALNKVLERLNITLSETVAVGDSANDLEMICAAGIGVAMGNASADVKLAADFVTGSVLEDGLVEAIRRYFN